METGTVEESILREITPSPEEARALMDAASSLLLEIEKTAAELGVAISPILVGSVAKGTFLKDPDIDAFMLFDPSVPREFLEEKGLAIGMKVLNGIKQYAEHPYVKGQWRGYDAEIVPCYRITDPSRKMSAVDRTPFHTKFVKDHLGPMQDGEVRLLKRFLKGIGAYGAEEAVRGFSGYLAELVALRYGTFRGVIEAAAAWQENIVLRIGETTQAPAASPGNPMVFVDPVDPSRNVASALSIEKYCLFTTACRRYIEEPRREFFFPNRPKARPIGRLRSEFGKRGTELLGIRIRTPEVIPDIYYSQLRKFERGIRTLCEDAGFHILHSGFQQTGKETLFLFEFEVHALPGIRKHFGPPVGNVREGEFTRKWEMSADRRSAVHIDDGLWTVQVRRDHATARALIGARIGTLNLGKHMNEQVKAGYRLLRGAALFSKGNALALSQFFDRRFPWEI